MFITVAVFFWQFIGFATDSNAVNLAGYWLPCSRGFAQICLFQMFGLLLAVMYSVLRKARSITVIDAYVPLDDNLIFHKICGYVLIISALLHSMCHFYGFFLKIQKAEPNIWFNGVLAEHLDGPNPTFRSLFVTIPGWTGCALLLTVLLITPFTFLRKRYYNLFWYSHYVFYTVFIILFTIHGLGSWLYTTQAWFWCGLPFLIYIIDRRHRVGNCKRQVEIQSVKFIGDRVVKIALANPFRSVKPGMYLYLNIPQLSRFEWHPFTIASGREEDVLVLVIENSGDWTRQLFQGLKDLSIDTVCIDGPIGAPTQRYEHYKTVICIAGGVGITPFMSLLQDEKCRIHLWWVSRDLACLESLLEDRLEEGNHQIHRYYTGRGEKLLQNSAIQTGRPNLSLMMNQFESDSTVAVFFCGHKKFEAEVESLCHNLAIPFFPERFH